MTRRLLILLVAVSLGAYAAACVAGLELDRTVRRDP